VSKVNVDPNRLVCLFLEEDEPSSVGGLKFVYERAFGSGIAFEDIRHAARPLVESGVLIEFDPESEAIDGALFDHPVHGQFAGDELTVLNVDTYFGLGPKAPFYVDQNKELLIEASLNGGLAEAFDCLRELSIDSSKWTGLQAGFKFTPAVQAKLLELLESARKSLGDIELSNSQASKASAYIDCAVLLTNSPEPEPGLVRELLKRLLLVVPIIGVFADLKSIFSL
jgi:hypothetical protein